MIKTIGELKKAISNIDDDFTIDVRVVRELPEEELSDSNYPYPYEYTKANLEIGDIGYSDKNVFINIEKISDDVCEWGIFDNSLRTYKTACGKYTGDEPNSKAFVYCPYCSNKIKVLKQVAEEDSRYCHNGSDDYHDCLDYMECEECPYYYADLD